jgi:SAM-dependent methyltransferase
MVLELGTGSGKWAAAFTFIGSHVTAVDNNQRMLERVIDNFPSLHKAMWLLNDDAAVLKWIPDKKYNLIFSEGLYEHFLDIEEREKLINLWYSKLAPNGECLIMVPNNNEADDEVIFDANSLAKEITSFEVFDQWIGFTIDYEIKAIGIAGFVGKKLL